jgi:hypothetical protein
MAPSGGRLGLILQPLSEVLLTHCHSIESKANPPF